MKIEIFGTGCKKCKELYKNTETALDELSLKAEVVKVEKMEDIVSRGILMSPAFAIDGELLSSGKILSVDDITYLLQKES